MKSFFLSVIIASFCIALKAQHCDLTDIFRINETPKPYSLVYCQDNTKNTAWLLYAVDYFKFDKDGNLVSHLDEQYTDVVRDERGVLKEATLGDYRYTFIVTENMLSVTIYKKQNNKLCYFDNYYFNKKGYVEKKIRYYDDGSKTTKKYRYVENTDDYWYIRKVTEKTPYKTKRYYECLKRIR